MRVQYVEQVMRGLSSQVERLDPAEAFVSLGGERRKAMADQITTASKRRLLGALGRDDLDAITRRALATRALTGARKCSMPLAAIRLAGRNGRHGRWPIWPDSRTARHIHPRSRNNASSTPDAAY